MKILLCHNFYKQPGGEDQVFADETWLLESHGHQVVKYTRHNDDVDQMSRWSVACKTLWNRKTYGALRRMIRRERPDLMHCTNTFPLISPAAYYAAQDEGVTVVQTLHNYRLHCVNGFFLRDGKICQDCLGKSFSWPGVRHGCYRGSRAGSAVVAALQTFHRARKTWSNAVDLYVTPTEFARDKFIEGGMSQQKIVVKPNFVHPDPGPGQGSGQYAVFVGRLSLEKGVDTLLDAWSRLPERFGLKIVGDGPMAEQVRRAAAGDDRIEWLGWRDLESVCSIVGEAKVLLMTSIWYEIFGRTITEAFAKGTPVIVSRLGAMAELVEDGRTGLHFEHGNAADLVAKVQQILADESALGAMRQHARDEYEAKYTPEANYDMLLDIYQRARGGSPAQPTEPSKEAICVT
jgi:glycosyltransferase involved in cell wall biosynthesis